MNTAQNFFNLQSDEVLKLQNSSSNGLSGEEAKSRLKKFGPNKLTSKKRISAFSIYLEQFKNSLTLILIGSVFLIIFIYFFGGRDSSDLIEAGLILTIILMITTLGFFQEYKAEKSIEALKKLLAYSAKVRRNNTEMEVDVSGLVPGDIVILEEGEKVPADIRLIEVYSLSTNEASLTGESGAVSKIVEGIEGNQQINDQKNIVFSGTSISSGRGVGVVIRTGDNTEIGKIAYEVSQAESGKTPIQVKLDSIGKTISLGVLLISTFVFSFVVFVAEDFTSLPIIERLTHSFVAAVALAVAAIPEGLPAVVTISLALGTRRMLKKNALVRKLNSVETLGSTDIICADKTGTLTKGEMTVREIFYDGKPYKVTGTGYEKLGKFKLNNQDTDPKHIRLLLKTGWECNNASISGDTILGDPTEAALLISAYKAGVKGKTTRVLEIPFSSERKMMSVVVEEGRDFIVYTKGAPDVILSKCSKIIRNNKEQIITSSEFKNNTEQMITMSKKSLRTLGFAYKKISRDQLEIMKKSPEKLESDLVFLGLQGMFDPPRIEIKPLIEKCNSSGIRIIMITGDHIETAKAVGSEIGIRGEALTGEMLDKLSSTDFEKATETVNIYARVNPDFKKRIVDTLKSKKHIVAMTGDGVNDAPALKKADIGIAMGITGTDVAKESSDMVLLDDNFSTIVYAIEEGRGIFHNIRKFVTYLLSCNIGEVLVVFFGILIFQNLALTATMLLWINVVTDGIPAISLGLDPAEKGILGKSPKIFQSEILRKRHWVEMFIFGIVFTISVLTLYGINLGDGVGAAQSAAFTSIVFFELVNLFIIRSSYKISILSNPNLVLAVIVAILIQLAIIFTPFLRQLFELEPMALVNWLYIAFGSLLIFVILKTVQIILDRTSIFSEATA